MNAASDGRCGADRPGITRRSAVEVLVELGSERVLAAYGTGDSAGDEGEGALARHLDGVVVEQDAEQDRGNTHRAAGIGKGRQIGRGESRDARLRHPAGQTLEGNAGEAHDFFSFFDVPPGGDCLWCRLPATRSRGRDHVYDSTTTLVIA